MAAPELRLDVRLNLATFRTDLGKAAQAAAAYYYPINLLVNKQNLTKQLTAIGRSLGTTKYNINLNDTSVVLAADKVEKLAASLKKLSGSIQIDFNAGGGAKPLGTAMREMAAKLAKESKGDINRAVEQMTGMRGASPFGTGTRSIPGFKAAAKGMGLENAFKLFFQELQQVDPQGLKKALDDGSVMMMQENREIKQKFDKIQSSAEGLARDLRAMGETAKATGKASLTAGGKTLYPQNYGLKIASLLGQVEKLDKDLRRVSTESGGELLNTLTELSSVLRTTSNSFVGIAGFSKNLDETLRGFDVATKAATRATTAYADRINRRGGGPAEATAGPRLLSGREPGGALVAPLRDDPYRVIQAQVKNAFDIIEDYHKRQLNNFTSGYKKNIEDYHRKILIQLASVTEYRPSQKLLGGTPPRLALPPVGGANTPERQVRISTGAYLGQPGFMRAPFVPPSMGGGGGLTGGAGGGTGGGPGNFAKRSGSGGGFNMPQLPGSGVVRELGEEFGFATKQVLLFGTAYKALAFLQGFPAQVGNAVSALQSFRNTLNAISPTAVDAAASNQLIIDTVDKYNIPIQSARNGFTKLYASMKPAGFSGEQIGNLFLGISKASATLGLSSDKVDRVTYAFSQMASKGQLMAEEVTGQLGDVIPGALSIMAEAANMDIKTFKKAMEDGMFTGKAFETVMSNVPIVMEKRFGKGAEGAAKTFQGALNDMQTSLTLLYEAFEPVAVAFLNAVVKPMTDGLQTITDGFNAFFTGQAAQTAGGNAFAQQLTDLKPAFDGILININALIPSFQIFGGLLLNVAKFLATLAGNPITGFLLKVYTNVLLVNTAFNLLGGKILLGLIVNINAAIFRLVAFGYAINAVGIQTTAANTALAGTQLQMLLLQRNAAGAIGPVNALLGSLLRLAGIGVIAIGITIAINNANELREAEERVARLRGEKNPVGPAGPTPILTAARSFTGASRETVQKARETQAPLLLQYRNELKALQAQLLTAQAIANASEDNAQAAAANVKLRTAQARVDAKQIDIQKAQAILNLNPQQYKTEAERQRASVGALAAITGGGAGSGKGSADKAAQDAERLAQQQQQRAIELANHESDLQKIAFDRDIQLDDSAFEHKKSLIDALNDYELSGLNDMQARQAKVVQDLKKIQLDAVDTVRKATQKAQEAQLNVVTAQRTAVAAGTGAPSAPMLPSPTKGPVSPRVGSSFQGFPVTSAPGESRAYRNGTHEGYDFATPIGTALSYAIGGVVKSINKVGSGNAGKTLEVVLDNGIIGMSMHLSEVLIEAGQRFTAGQLLAKTGDTGAGPAHLHQESAPHAYKSGQAGASLAYLNIGKGKAASGASFRMETKQQTEGFDLIEAKARQSAVTELQRIEMQRAVELAYVKTAAVIKTNIDTIFPVEKQKLDLRLQQMRQNLLMQGMPEEYIDYEMNRAAAMEESAMATKNMETSLASAKIELAVYNDAGKKGVELTIEQQVRMGLLKKEIEGYEAGLASLTNQQKAYNIAALESAIASIKNADALKTQQDAIQLIDGNVESATGSYKNFIKEVARGGDAKEALKKFQESITDQVLTVFLDYSFKPVEEFFKNSLKNMFGLPDAEKAKQDQLAKMEAQLVEQKRIAVATEQTAANTTPGAGANAGTTQSPVAGSAFAPGGTLPAAAAGFDAASVFGNPEALTGAFGGVQASISESMNGIVSSFENGASSLGNALPAWDTALSTNIPDALKTATNDTNKATPTFQESLGKVTAGIGIAAGAIMGIAAGISQIKEGGTSNVLGGIGSVLMSLGGAVGGFAGFFKGANGGVAGGGWKPFPVTAFANGGMVNGPTLGLVGEGKYNEAIVPLPDGRSIPVQMKGPSGGGLREAMSGNNGKASGSPILNMSFQSTNINGVEYVSRDQLEAAMATTRKQAAKDGANRGMTMTLDKLQQSPQTRNRLGMG